MNPIYASRRRTDIVVRFLCLGAAAFGVVWLALILFTLFYNGVAGLNLQVFTENTPPPGSTEGGLLNAIVGSLIMTVLGVGIGAPLLRLTRIVFDARRRPVERVVALYRADAYQYRMHLQRARGR